MARKKFDLNMRSLDRLMVLSHGEYGSGKTHLAGDMLRTEAEFGPVAFINVKGEDGYMSLANLDLGSIGEEVETLDDFVAAIMDLRKANLRALAVDSLKHLLRAVITKKCGPGKAPVIGKTQNDWPDIHRWMEDVVISLRQAAPYIMCVCPSDKSVNQITGEIMITPDLPGREAVGSAGWFDLVGFIKAETLNAGKINRVFRVTPVPGLVTRQRLPKPITTDIVIPNGGGGWQAIKDELNRSLALS